MLSFYHIIGRRGVGEEAEPLAIFVALPEALPAERLGVIAALMLQAIEPEARLSTVELVQTISGDGNVARCPNTGCDGVLTSSELERDTVFCTRCDFEIGPPRKSHPGGKG